MSCVSVSSFLLRMAPTDPCRQTGAITTSPEDQTNPRPGVKTPTGITDLDGFGDLVDVLRLDDGPQVVLQDFCEVVLQLRTSEVG